MRTALKPALRLVLLPFALLLGAAPDRIPLPQSFPACRRSEFVTVQNGELVCRELVKRLLSNPPDCTGQLASATLDPKQPWVCGPRAFFSPTELDALSAQLVQIKDDVTRIEKLSAIGPQLRNVFVGTTTLVSTGHIRRTDTAPGLISANAMCNDEFPGSHFCSGYELHQSVMAGVISARKGMARAWVFHPSWKTPVGPAARAEEGLADNCASYTYGFDDRGWTGIAAEFATTNLNTTEPVLAFRGGTLAPCSGQLPLSCCK